MTVTQPRASQKWIIEKTSGTEEQQTDVPLHDAQWTFRDFRESRISGFSESRIEHRDLQTAYDSCVPEGFLLLWQWSQRQGSLWSL